jgi:hypothetical protein
MLEDAREQRRPDIGGWLEHGALWASIVAAAILAAVLLGNLAIRVQKAGPALWLLALVEVGPLISALLGNFAMVIGYYGTWRLLRGRDEFGAGDTIRDEALSTPGRLQGIFASPMGRTAALSALLLVTSLVVAGLTLAPPPLRVLGAALHRSTHATGQSSAEVTPTAATSPPLGAAPTASPATTATATATASPSPQASPARRPTSTPMTTPAPVAFVSTPGVTPTAGRTSAPPPQLSPTPHHPQPSPTPSRPKPSPTSSPTSSPTPSPTSSPTPSPTPSPSPSPRPSFAFTVFPTTLSQQCTDKGQALSSVVITLDNSASTVSVSWAVTIAGTVPGTHAPWAIAFPRTGTVLSGRMASLTLSPHASLCARLSKPTTYHATVTVTSGGTAAYPIADTIVPTDDKGPSNDAKVLALGPVGQGKGGSGLPLRANPVDLKAVSELIALAGIAITAWLVKGNKYIARRRSKR